MGNFVHACGKFLVAQPGEYISHLGDKRAYETETTWKLEDTKGQMRKSRCVCNCVFECVWSVCEYGVW